MQDSSPQQNSLAALVCTHKRGAALALFPVKHSSMSDALGAAAQQLAGYALCEPQVSALPLTGAQTHFFVDSSQHFIAAVCAGLTAENLADVYRFALNSLQVDDANVSHIGVVEGPGSFTGLRLGSAFANGLHIGRGRNLWAVAAQHPDVVRQRVHGLEISPHELFVGLQSDEHDDPFAIPASFGDLLVHLEQWQSGNARQVAVIEPVYGRDPTPVIKLRQKQESTQS